MLKITYIKLQRECIFSFHSRIGGQVKFSPSKVSPGNPWIHHLPPLRAISAVGGDEGNIDATAPPSSLGWVFSSYYRGDVRTDGSTSTSSWFSVLRSFSYLSVRTELTELRCRFLSPRDSEVRVSCRTCVTTISGVKHFDLRFNDNDSTT